MKRILESRIFFILVLVIVICGLPVLTLLLIDSRERAVRPQPLRYFAVPDPLLEPLCPGDTLPYSFGFDLDAGPEPVALTIDRGIWSVDEGRFFVGSKQPITYPYTSSARIKRTSTYVIPELTDEGKPFPSGQYEFRVTGESEGRQTVGFAIPFTIPGTC